MEDTTFLVFITHRDHVEEQLLGVVVEEINFLLNFIVVFAIIILDAYHYCYFCS